jgi:hypothetical protein
MVVLNNHSMQLYNISTKHVSAPSLQVILVGYRMSVTQTSLSLVRNGMALPELHTKKNMDIHSSQIKVITYPHIKKIGDVFLPCGLIKKHDGRVIHQLESNG